MYGYTTSKDLFKGNSIDYNLKQAVAYSGGNTKHYNFFKSLITYSIRNVSTNKGLMDARAGQLLLHLFPIKVQIMLSILFYKYETNLIEEYSAYSLDTSNILLPSTQLSHNSIITKNNISSSLTTFLDNTVAQTTSINDTSLAEVKRLLNIEFSVNSLDGRLIDNVEGLLSQFKVSTLSRTKYLDIIKTNNRLESAIVTAQTLNYKPKSIDKLAEAITLWHQNSST